MSVHCAHCSTGGEGTIAMMKVAQHLWFEKDMEAAVCFYISLIPGSSIRWMSPVPADNDNPGGLVRSGRLAGITIGDQRYIALEGGTIDRLTTVSPLWWNAMTRPNRSPWERIEGRRIGGTMRLVEGPLGSILADHPEADR
jgi:3-demethylubiquinone-9 3-methyltransferase